MTVNTSRAEQLGQGDTQAQLGQYSAERSRGG